jgi:hypothetical protein
VRYTGKIRTVALLSTFLAVGLMFSACGSSKSGSGGGATTSTTSATDNGTSPQGGDSSTSSSTTSGGTQASTTYYSKGQIISRSPTVPAPKQSSGYAVSKDIQSGQQILIYQAGFWPNQLYANELVPVVWTNMTKVTQTVSIVGIGVKSPPIPPGDQWEWKTTGGGVLAYRSAVGSQGILNFQYPTPVTLAPSAP